MIAKEHMPDWSTVRILYRRWWKYSDGTFKE